MFAVSASPVAPLRAGARPTRRARRASARAFFTKEKAKPVATKTGKKLSQDESMKEMSSIVAQPNRRLTHQYQWRRNPNRRKCAIADRLYR